MSEMIQLEKNDLGLKSVSEALLGEKLMMKQCDMRIPTTREEQLSAMLALMKKIETNLYESECRMKIAQDYSEQLRKLKDQFKKDSGITE